MAIAFLPEMQATFNPAPINGQSNSTPILNLFADWQASLGRADGADAAIVFEEENNRALLVRLMRAQRITGLADLAALFLAETNCGEWKPDERGSLLICWDLVN